METWGEELHLQSTPPFDYIQHPYWYHQTLHNNSKVREESLISNRDDNCCPTYKRSICLPHSFHLSTLSIPLSFDIKFHCWSCCSRDNDFCFIRSSVQHPWIKEWRRSNTNFIIIYQLESIHSIREQENGNFLEFYIPSKKSIDISILFHKILLDPSWYRENN